MVAEEVGAEKGLASSRREAHVVDAHSPADHREGVTGEVDVGDGVDENLAVSVLPREHHVGERHGLRRPELHLVGADALDDLVDEGDGVIDVVETLPHRVAEARAVDTALGEVLVGELGARALVGIKRLGDQLVEIEHLDALVAEHLSEAVVLGLRHLEERDVVKEQRREVIRRQVEELPARPMEHDLPERADLRVDVQPQWHGTSLVVERKPVRKPYPTRTEMS